MIYHVIGAICLVLAVFSFLLLCLAIYQNDDELFGEIAIGLAIFLLAAIVAFK